MRTRSMKAAMKRHPELTARPVSCRDLLLQFQPVPSDSLKELLIKMGPFVASTDAFRFDNNHFTITDEEVEQIRQRYRLAIDFVLGASPLQFVRDVLHRLRVDVPIIGNVGLPDFIIDAVIGDVRTELASLLTGLIFDMLKPGFGRCGGMAFSAYDFYLLGWTVDERLGTNPLPSTGVLGDYIFSRLLDSLDLNVGTFLEWFTNLHLMPKLSDVANVALLAAVSSWGGPIGAAFGAFLCTQVHVFDLGGPKALLKSSKDEWPRIMSMLDGQAAWPVGLLFGGSDAPWNDHQLLALSYVDNGDGTAKLTVWDNRDTPNPLAFSRDLTLDFTHDDDGLRVHGSGFQENIRGLFLEEYSPRQPPDSLRLPPV
jgi:hypothetical protein